MGSRISNTISMKLNSPSLPAIGIIIFLVLLGACKKSNVSGGTDSTNIPFITPIGDTAGAPVSASIGPTGGSLTSSDGRVQLVIPAGALSQTTIITIQPIINLCPGGIGLAYDLQPTGTKFSTPASFIFHYSDSDVNGTEPLLITSAFQDSANAWEFNDTEKDVDSINKKISFDINHFCPYGFIPEIVIFARPQILTENQTSQIKVQVWVVPKSPATYHGAKYVQSKADVDNSLVTNWHATTTTAGTSGTLTSKGSSAVFQAPSNIDKDAEVSIGCDINVPVTVKLKGGTISTPPTPFHLLTYIQLSSGVYSMNLSVLVAMHQTSFFIADRYTDGATMQVDVKYNDVTISKIVNQAPSVDPAVGPFGSGAVAWVPDLIGVTNILPTSTGKFTADAQGGGDIALSFMHSSSTVYPKWVLTSPNGPAQYSGGYSVHGQPVNVEFHTQTTAQTLYLIGNVGYDSIYFTITPIH
jgi:hypothetical protein